MFQFASVDDLGALTTLGADEEAAADMLLSGATAAIQRHTGQQIGFVADDSVVLAGTWDRELVLPQWPVIDVTAVTFNGTAVAPGTWLSAGRKLWRGNLPIFNGPDDWGGDLLLTSWGGPMAQIGVVYSHGLTPIPFDVQSICMQAALRALRNPSGDTSETIGNYSHTMAESAVGVFLTESEKAALDVYNPSI